MISFWSVRVADWITEIARHFRMRFVNYSGRKIAARVFARQPICRERNFVVDRLFDRKLSACANRVRRDDIFWKNVSARRQARFVKSFRRRRVRICAEFITPVSDRNIKIRSGEKRDFVFFVLISMFVLI